MLAAAFVIPYMVPANFGLNDMWFIWFPAYTAPANAPGIASINWIPSRSQPSHATPSKPNDGTIEAKIRNKYTTWEAIKYHVTTLYEIIVFVLNVAKKICNLCTEFVIIVKLNVPSELNNLYDVDTDRYPLLKSQSAKMLVNIPNIQLVKYGMEDKIAFWKKKTKGQ